MTDAREQVIAGLEAAIRDINCPLQYSPLMMEAAKLLRRVSPPEPTEGQIEAAARGVAAITDPGKLWSEISVNWQEHHRILARAALRAMPLQDRVSEWQPIETAPQNEPVLIGGWRGRQWTEAVGYIESGDRIDPFWTHWHPRPAAPPLIAEQETK